MKSSVAKSVIADDIGITPTQQMFASCSGALITSFLVTPFDVVKIRMQADRRGLKPGHCFLYSNGLMDHLCTCSNPNLMDTAPSYRTWYMRPSKFDGTVDAFTKIVRNEGIRSLWSGLQPTLVMAVPATVIYFTVYDNLNENLQRRFGPSPLLSMFAGGTARFFVVSVISPLEMIRTKMQSEQIGWKGIAKAIRVDVGTSGLKVLYQGWTATVLRDVPFSALYWGGYETLKKSLNNGFSSAHSTASTFTISFISGAFSGAVAALITLPFDVVKTHRQIELGEKPQCRDPSAASTYGMLKRLYVTQGAASLFSGAVPRIVKVAPACAIMIGTYEYFKVFFRNRNSLLKQDNLGYSQ